MFIDFREEGRERRTDVREKYRSLPPIHAQTRDWTCNLGMCSDWELSPQPIGVWDDATTNWTIRPGLNPCFLIYIYIHISSWPWFGSNNVQASLLLLRCPSHPGWVLTPYSGPPGLPLPHAGQMTPGFDLTKGFGVEIFRKVKGKVTMWLLRD